MKEINWKELIENEYNIFHCETEEIANQLLRIAHEHGYKWRTKDSYLDYNYWDKYCENTCYWIGDSTYNSIQYFETQRNFNLNIINVNDILNVVRRPFKLNRK